VVRPDSELSSQNDRIDYFEHYGQNHRMAKNPPLTVTATEAKTRFGPLLEAAIAGGSVIITKHDTPKAVLLSIAEFEALGGNRPPDLHALSAEFDGLLARLQTPAARKALKSAFAADPKTLGRLAGTRRRRRG
jgi:prevent-host-death family protein